MAKKTQNKYKNNKISNLILLVIVVAIIVSILYKVIKLIVVPTNIFIVKNGIVSEEEVAVGYVIRDEKIVKGEGDSDTNIVQIKAEGEKTANKEYIFRYVSNNEEEINTKINELNTKIQEAMEGQTDLFSSDIKAIDNQIENKIDGLKSKNNIQSISEYKKDINTYITKKSKIAGELSKSGSYVKELIEEREKYQTELEKKSEYVKAPMSGVVSYRVDNMEETLTPNNFNDLSKKTLEEFNLKTGQVVATSNKIGKVINNYECYIASIMNSDEAREAKEGNKVTLRLSTQDEISATIEYVKQEDNDTIIVFKINKCVEKLIDYRKISFDVIWWKYEGLKIPKNSIIYDNGLSYVIRNVGGYNAKILIKILKENDNYCIVGNYKDSELKELGYSSNEIYEMRKISMYDEIVANPDIKNMEMLQ